MGGGHHREGRHVTHAAASAVTATPSISGTSPSRVPQSAWTAARWDMPIGWGATPQRHSFVP